MIDIDDIRRANLVLLEKELGGPTKAAESVGMSTAQFSNLRSGALDSKTGKPRGMRKETARRIELAAGKPNGWLDIDHRPEGNDTPVAETPKQYAVRNHNVRRIWAVGRGSGGFMPSRIWTDGDYPVGCTDEYAEEASADPHAFLIEVDNTSMETRYMHGEFALIEPSTAPVPGEDVLVRLKSGETLLKRLESNSAGIRLRSLSIEETFFYKLEDVDWVYYAAHPVPRRKIKMRM